MLITLITIWLAAGIAASLLAWPFAVYKRRLVSFWTFWSFWLPPMLLVLLLAPRNAIPTARKPGWDETAALGDNDF